MSWSDQAGFPLLSAITFLPLAGVLVILALAGLRSLSLRGVPQTDGDRARTLWPTTYKTISLVVTLAAFALACFMMLRFDTGAAGMQFVEDVRWIPQFNIHYSTGVDGIAALLLFLTTLLGFIVIIASWYYVKEREMGFFISLLLLQVGMSGVFIATDLFLFYVLWEAMLVPMYFIIGIWGGPRRIYAAIKFFLFTLVGSLLMLVAIIAVVYYVDRHTGTGLTFDIQQLSRQVYPYQLQVAAFLAFFLAFAIKVPMWPFHTWLPDAHVEAPTAGSVILAGVLLKMGGYGILRFCLPFFPDAAVAFVPYIAVLSVIAILYGAFVAMVQKDLKKLVAYSSVSHMGFVTAGIFASIALAGNAAGMEGAILVMFNHGILTGALFLLVGFLYERTHTRDIASMGMLAKPLPVLAGFFLFFSLGSLGLPGLNGFVGEFLSLLGLFEYSRLLAAIGAVGVILAACYLLWMFQRVWFNDRGDDEVTPAISLRDFGLREIVSLLPLVAFAIWAGVYPDSFLQYLHVPVQELLDKVGPSMESARGDAFAQLVDFTKGLF
jgi:NADH-quinone oxidoreductase subunit M